MTIGKLLGVIEERKARNVCPLRGHQIDEKTCLGAEKASETLPTVWRVAILDGTAPFLIAVGRGGSQIRVVSPPNEMDELWLMFDSVPRPSGNQAALISTHLITRTPHSELFLVHIRRIWSDSATLAPLAPPGLLLLPSARNA